MVLEAYELVDRYRNFPHLFFLLGFSFALLCFQQPTLAFTLVEHLFFYPILVFSLGYVDAPLGSGSQFLSNNCFATVFIFFMISNLNYVH